MKTRTIVLKIEVQVPIEVKAEEVSDAINWALDEKPSGCDWGNWTVGPVLVYDQYEND